VPTFYARTVFFVRDASRAMAFYTKELGFSLDWMHEEDGKPHVFQVSLHGFELILNQTEPPTVDRPGHGRAFIGLDSEGYAAFKQHVESTGIKTITGYWGAPTVAIHDADQNEIFFWLPDEERQKLEAGGAGAA
jgi:catechol 2,3-dioxygenase-like lactoylglutathione lyase family enzyme